MRKGKEIKWREQKAKNNERFIETKLFYYAKKHMIDQYIFQTFKKFFFIFNKKYIITKFLKKWYIFIEIRRMKVIYINFFLNTLIFVIL